MTSDSKGAMDRRTVLKVGSGAGVAALAGCISTNSDDGGDTDTPTDGGGGGGGDNTQTTDGGGGGGTNRYEIGMVDATTGSLSAFGQRNQRGKDLALAAVNDVGVKDGELGIVVEDSASEPQGGVSAAQKLVNQDGVPFLIGAVGSGVSLAIYESVVQGTDVVQLSQNSTGLSLSNFPGLLRMSPTGSTQSRALANIIAEDGHDSVAVTYVNNDYGQSLADAFVENWDGEIAYNNSHDQEQQSYSSVVSQMNSSGADAWLFITYQPEFATMVNEMYSSGYDAPLYGADSVSGTDVLENTPEGSMDGMKIVVPSAPVEEENYQQFVSEFEAEYDEQPTVWSAYAYDCVINAALAVQAADEFTGAALQETVREVTRPEGEQVTSYEDAQQILADGGGPSDVDYQGVSGPIDFDENGDPKGFLQILEVQGHDYVGIGFIEG
ncbi:ABC transporter substrate-binding protein [Haloarchaeobius iranensis]|uniref:Branched-chain amino acid transport system substrate-binding protein n=1 Tax=Haloarchaeobius iranensis TaxID=996166 RepID=A0A1G9Y0N8_9EURY|nr:ABC transporter substrate-binding protein [Haloarchaeobius iranensis]SDN02634.1 branched-chain amino acid transport system substrate-binding protein [Haloarchaeobius iranensis]